MNGELCASFVMCSMQLRNVKCYESPEMEIILLKTYDVVTLSESSSEGGGFEVLPGITTNSVNTTSF